MTTLPTTEQELVKAQAALRLRDDKALQELLDELEDSYIDLWRKATDEESRERLWYKQDAIQSLRNEINVRVERAELSEDA